MLRIVLLEKSLRKIRDILSRVTLPGDVDFVSLHTKSINEPLPEIVELIRNIDLILNGRRTRRKARTGWLINVNHIRQVVERIWVSHGLIDARLPQKGAMLLKQAVERAATGSAVEPDSDLFLIVVVWVRRGKEPEK